MTLKQYMIKHGFEVEQTGGGCTAYAKELENGDYWLITEAEGCNHPENMYVRATIGLYSNDGDNKYINSMPMKELCLKVENILREWEK